LPRDAHWVQPELVCEVSFGEWTRDGKIRHSVFHGLRTDKPAAAVGEEPVLHAPPVDKPAAKPRKSGTKTVQQAPTKTAATATPPAAAAAVALPPTLRVSNPERVVDPQSGITKIALVRYYALVAPLMMPHLDDRPIAMVRRRTASTASCSSRSTWIATRWPAWCS
jgi:bifunctional non-homologous end joining protein LigD